MGNPSIATVTVSNTNPKSKLDPIPTKLRCSCGRTIKTDENEVWCKPCKHQATYADAVVEIALSARESGKKLSMMFVERNELVIIYT